MELADILRLFQDYRTIPLAVTLLIAQQRASQVESLGAGEATVETVDTTTTITLAVVGDLMSHGSQIRNAKTDSGQYDYTPCFKEITPFLKRADFTIGNFETTCYGPSKPYKGYPVFNTPDAFVAALKIAGFNLMVTANNHSMDTGEKGLLRTIDVIVKDSMHYSGTFKSQKDRDTAKVYNIQGQLKLAVLSYTYGTNYGLPGKGKEYMLNLIDTAAIRKDIQLHRDKGAEIVLVYLHYGTENARLPSSKQKQTVQEVTSLGADIIIGCHPHVISPVRYYKGDSSTLDSGFVAYSTGNFISNQYWRYTDAGVILYLDITKNRNTGKISITETRFLPTWVYRGQQKSILQQHVVLPAQWGFADSTVLPYLDSALTYKMKQAFNDTKDIISRFDTTIQLLQTKSPD